MALSSTKRKRKELLGTSVLYLVVVQAGTNLRVCLSVGIEHLPVHSIDSRRHWIFHEPHNTRYATVRCT